MRLDDCSALITGASAGIGHECARQLAPRAGTLVLVARRADRLEQLRHELTTAHPRVSIVTRAVDLRMRGEIDALVQWLRDEKIEIDLLINNAGLGDLGAFATSDPERNDAMLLVNVVALTTLTRHFLPQMIARKRGAILNVSSSAGFLPIAEFAVYAATKAYVNSFTEGLRSELRGTGVSVCALCPGPVHTEFNQVAQRAGHPGDNSPEFAYVSVEKVVSDGLAAVEADRPLVIPGLMMKIGMFLVRLTPMSILRRVRALRR